MPEFIKGMELCEGFFKEEAEPIINKCFPNLKYSAGLIGYGSDVLGYDDPVSTDHMWGPRFYMFISDEDLPLKNEILNALSDGLPYTYKGFGVNFSKPDPKDNGVRHPEFITSGRVDPLIWIQTFDSYLKEQLGTSDLASIKPLEWLKLSEHRLLSLVSGRFFKDDLKLSDKLKPIRYYPHEVKLYLAASLWSFIASEQAFVKRAADCGDDTGSRIITSRIAEHLMRLCFLYSDTYAPYSKWFGTAFSKLIIDESIKNHINKAVSAGDADEREKNLVGAQLEIANLHNASRLTEKVDVMIEDYYGRDIKVIFAYKIVEAIQAKLLNTPFENTPLVGSFSQHIGFSDFADDVENNRGNDLWDRFLLK